MLILSSSQILTLFADIVDQLNLIHDFVVPDTGNLSFVP